MSEACKDIMNYTYRLCITMEVRLHISKGNTSQCMRVVTMIHKNNQNDDLQIHEHVGSLYCNVTVYQFTQTATPQPQQMPRV